jgi:hypothetical protein
MKSFSEKFEKIMMAITFAESGEHETAREIMRTTERTSTERPTVWKRPRDTRRQSPPGK